MAITNLSETTWKFKTTLTEPSWSDTGTFRYSYPKVMDVLFNSNWTHSTSSGVWSITDSMGGAPMETYNSSTGWIADGVRTVHFGSTGSILTDATFIE